MCVKKFPRGEQKYSLSIFLLFFLYRCDHKVDCTDDIRNIIAVVCSRDVVSCGVVWCGAVRCGELWCGVVRCGAVWSGVV